MGIKLTSKSDNLFGKTRTGGHLSNGHFKNFISSFTSKNETTTSSHTVPVSKGRLGNGSNRNR